MVEERGSEGFRLASVIVLGLVACGLVACGAQPAEQETAVFAGNDVCASCHKEELKFVRYGAHRAVLCERCHGPGGDHAAADAGSRPRMKLGGPGLCLSCHGGGAASTLRLTSRISSFEDHLSALEREHRITLHRERSGTTCVFCHDPHLLE